MSIYNYEKYKISINKDAKKIQGLQVGDIVRRQYYDGTNLIYTLMCVLEEGVDDNECKYFVGALLEGDAPKSDELLDFVRVTNLFNADRSGAVYLTSNDSNSPYMDVIDGLGSGKSLCYPQGLSSQDYTDSTTQYVVKGGAFVNVQYIDSDSNIYRICKLTRNSSTTSTSIGITQNFNNLIVNPNRVLISFKAKASKAITANVSLAYSDGTLEDGNIDISVGSDWKYYFIAITVENSGRFSRKLDITTASSNLSDGEFICIGELNAVLLSDISNFSDFTQTRIGKLDGINDGVFGTLKGYGAYLSNLYASKSANVSGTLTAGDENGFGSTFYAGRIYKNNFINSISPGFSDSENTDDIASPTGMGNVIKIGATESSVTCQTNEWIKSNNNKDYTLSFWVYSEKQCTFTVYQNTKSIKSIQVSDEDVYIWRRVSVSFKIYDSESDMIIAIKPDNPIYVSSFQLEKGEIATQYQPTDDCLEQSDEYGAWFNRGGIGGTIQNPLIKLNFDGEGSVGTKTKSLLLKIDGSGYLANKNILWDEFGNITFGENVKLGWDNISQDVQDSWSSKSIKIIGGDVFMFNNYVYQPETIELQINKYNIPDDADTVWYYYDSLNVKQKIQSGVDKISIDPSGKYWSVDYLIIECSVTYEGVTYSDAITIRKHFNTGYSVVVSSSNGLIYQDNEVETTLSANVYYHGALIDPNYSINYFTFKWKRYYKNNGEWVEDTSFSSDDTATLKVSDITQDNDVQYKCLIYTKEGTGFPYNFPVIFGS